MTKKCVVCGEVFEAQRKDKKYCSLKCNNGARYLGIRIPRPKKPKVIQRLKLTPFTFRGFQSAPPEKMIRLLGRL